MATPLARGSIGIEVATWQQILGISADGIFGPHTDAATRAWQQAHALVPDGIVGPQTWAAADELRPAIMKGVDLSAIQGVLDDATWRKLAESEIRFAIMRAVVGNETWIDGAARENGQRAQAHGIVAGAYVFAYPLPHLDPVREAESFVRKLEGMGTKFGDLPPALDAEWPPREEWRANPDGTRTLVYPWKTWNCNAEQLRDWLLRCLERGEELTGCRWIVYSYRYWLECIEAAKAPDLAQRPLWLADYSFRGRWPSIADIAKLKPAAPWPKITIVQHDGNGGLKLPDGRDADFNCFLGSESELTALAGARVHPSPPISDGTIAEYRRTRPTDDSRG